MFVFGRAVAGAIDGFAADQPTTGLTWLGVLALAAFAGAVGSRLIYFRLADIVEPFRDDLVRRVVGGALRSSTSGAQRPDTAAVARLTNQVEIVRDTFAGMIMIVFTFAFTLGAALLGMLSLVPIVLLLVLPPLLLGLGLFLATLARLAVRQREYVLADERVAESASTVTGALRDVVASGAEERVRQSVGVHVDEQARAARAVARLAAARVLALAICGWLPAVLVLAGAPWLMRNGASVGAIVGTLAYLTYGLQPALNTLMHGVAASGLRLVVTLDRILEATETPAQADTAGQSVVGSPGETVPPIGDLELRHVTFAYGRHAAPVISDVDLVIADSDHLAIVGPSGIGKSTLANLITGMLTPDAGDVLLGGTPIRDLDVGSWTRSRVLIPQEAYVFVGTLEENLAYHGPVPSRVALDAAVDAVGLTELVERIGGYDAELDPTSLSAGERQLIALTRAYLSPARLAVLDEATCHLDPEAEARAEHAFSCRTGTLVVVAHRVSSALRAQRILAMDGDRVLLGTHDTLLVESPLYRDLVGHWQVADPAPALEKHP